ncbi:MAG: SRPBCC domain-containing protein [Chitinophagaceae bacterium]
MELTTVAATVNAPIEKIWEAWSHPVHIMHWNNASADWQTTFAENDLQKGGIFSSRMEAKDGSFGFDFGGVYDKVKQHEQIAYTMDDGRKVNTRFSAEGDCTTVTTIFEPESQNPVDMQKAGWQNIMDNFKTYVEKASTITPLHFETTINAPVEKVYATMIDEKSYNEWTAAFNPTSNYKGSWNKNAKILFIGTDKDGLAGGMVSRIKENMPNKFISIEHLGLVKGEEEITSGAEVEGWAGALENYTFKSVDGNTLLSIDMDSNEDYKTYFSETWPKALTLLKTICEK